MQVPSRTTEIKYKIQVQDNEPEGVWYDLLTTSTVADAERYIYNRAAAGIDTDLQVRVVEIEVMTRRSVLETYLNGVASWEVRAKETK